MSIKLIAKMAGTSVATVSRVLSDPDYKCRDEQMRKRIWKAAQEINYVPNEAARNLKRGVAPDTRTYRINVLMTRSDGANADPFYTELLGVIESELHKNMCMLCNVWYYSAFSSDRKADRDRAMQLVNDMSEGDEDAEGLIIIGRCNRDVLRRMKEKFHNIVSVNRNSTNYEVDEVLCDGYKIASMAVGHLMGLGHKSIAYVGEVDNEARYSGYVDTMNKNRCELVPEYIFNIRQTETEGYRVMEKVLGWYDRPTAFYCANDITAIGMLKCLNHYRNRYYIPSVISSDNIRDSELSRPMLTTVNLPKGDMGRFTVDLLLDRIKGGHGNVVRLEIECNLMARNSCSPVDEANVTEYYI
jgi:sulfate transport system ATP-binding protein/LacI family transcriptional regulator/LacI family repressor for deo operon, udp, cdd, tsx, nupC, and nupG